MPPAKEKQARGHWIEAARPLCLAVCQASKTGFDNEKLDMKNVRRAARMIAIARPRVVGARESM